MEGEGERNALIVSGVLNSFKHQIIFSFNEILLRSDFFYSHQKPGSSKIPPFIMKSILYHLELLFQGALNAIHFNENVSGQSQVTNV